MCRADVARIGTMIRRYCLESAMKPKSESAERPAARRARRSPWYDVTEGGESLAVEDFPVTLIVQLGNALRRSVTTPYAEQFGLSEVEWRMLTLVVNFSPLSMVDLVSLSASDKALVSRTVKALKEKGLLEVLPDPGGHLKRLVCQPTRKGRALHAKVFPVAQAQQARILLHLQPEERDALYRALRVLIGHYCVPGGHSAGD